MIGYHIDRSNQLKENSLCDLIKDYELENTFTKFENSFSKHGISYLSKDFINNSNYGSFFWEFALEYVRLLNFPHLPSRFQSIFACRNLKEIVYWKHFFENQGFTNLKTFEVSYDKKNSFVGDANWFNLGGLHNSIQTSKFDNISWASYLYYSNKYWSGEFTSKPHIELIIKLPCNIKNLVIN